MKNCLVKWLTQAHPDYLQSCLVFKHAGLKIELLYNCYSCHLPIPVRAGHVIVLWYSTQYTA